jgi:opacity protein-like surface antigen
MSKLAVFAGGAAALMAVAFAAPTAQASEPAPVKPRSVTAAAADGKLHAWEHQYRGGKTCSWSGSNRNWDYPGNGCPAMRNIATSVENRGYDIAYGDVNLYWGIDQGGAYACLGNGDAWMDLSLGIERFDHGLPWWSGMGESLHDNISSHQWTDSC